MTQQDYQQTPSLPGQQQFPGQGQPGQNQPPQQGQPTQQPQLPSPSQIVRVEYFRPFSGNGAARGFFQIELISTSMVIKDLTVNEKDGQWWISFPYKKYVDKKTNEEKYTDVVYHKKKENWMVLQNEILQELQRGGHI